MTTTITPPTEQPVRLMPRAAPVASTASTERWSVDAIEALFNLPFNELIHRAQTVHREHFDPTEVELATLLSVKTGGCPEDCGYCPQSVHFDTGVAASKLMDVAAVREAAQVDEAEVHGEHQAAEDQPADDQRDQQPLPTTGQRSGRRGRKVHAASLCQRIW